MKNLEPADKQKALPWRKIYKQLFDQMNVAIMILDQSCHVVYLNPKAEKIMGYNEKETIGRECCGFETSLCNTELCTVKQLATGQPVSEFQRGGGFYQANVAKIEDPGATGYIIIMQDTTAQRELEQQLYLSKERLSVTLAQMWNSIWEYDIATKTFTRTGGLLEEYYLQESFEHAPEAMVESQVIHPNDGATFLAMFSRILNGEQQAKCTVRWKKNQGNYGWVNISFITLLDNEGQPLRAIGILEDVDEQKQIELRFLQEEEYRHSFTSDALSSYEFNLTQDKLIVADQKSIDFLGVKVGDSYTKAAKMAAEKAVHPEDREAFEAYISRQAMLDAFENGQQERELEFRSTDYWGEMIWVRHIAHIIREPLNGDVCCFIYLKNIDEKKRGELAVKERAERDPMTGLYNQVTLRNKVHEALKNCSSHDKASFYMIDIDNFKQVNDRFGHWQGDYILTQMAEKLKSLFGENALLGRVGGDEFAALWPQTSSEQDALEVAEKICHTLQHQWNDYQITGSVGVSFFPRHGVEFQDLYEKADIALYQAKKEGKNRFTLYEQSLHMQEQCNNMVAERLIDELDEIVYVSDPQTYELIYINRMGRKVMDFQPDNYRGKKCYKMLHNKDEPCDFCTNGQLQYGAFSIWEHTNTFLNRHYLLKDKLIEWDGRPVRMEIAIDISEKENISQELRSRLEIEQMLLNCIRTLFETDDLDMATNLVLKNLATFYQADRAYILEFDMEREVVSNTYEWCSEGISSQLNQLQDIPLAQAPDWKKAVQTQQPILWNDIEEIREQAPDEYTILKSQNIQSLYGVPFRVQSGLNGFLGVDNPRAHYNDVSLLSSSAYFIMNEIVKRRMGERLQYMGYHDPLTGLYNRNFFADTLKQLQTSPPVCLGILVADINGLKQMNACYGQAYGDDLIRAVADILKRHFNASLAFRLSGDEFVVLCLQENYTLFHQQCEYAKAELEQLENGVSLGYIWDNMDVDVNRLMRHADELLVVQKQVYYRDADVITKRHRPERVRKLKEALTNGCFVMYLQPKKELETGRLSGAEALIRYQDETHGLVSPDKFIPSLEREYLIREIDLFVFEEVCRLLACWHQEGRRLLPISLNFSRLTMMESGLLDTLLTIHSRYKVPRGLIEIEITESAGEMERETLFEIGSKFTRQGFRISLDDFGSKYSSTFILSVLPWNVLKIDRSLINGLMTDERTKIIIRHVVEMCREFHIEVIAEGIETEEQLQLLLTLGCCFGQGYLLGRPMPVEEFSTLYYKDFY